MNPALVETAHRPYPMQDGPWIMSQAWHDLLFAHWPVSPDAVRDTLPPGLELDLFGGEAWLGVVPFRMSGVRPRFTPPVPGLSYFPELNLRTYVVRDGRPGVWFYTLEASNKIAVRIARTWFHLPYHDARMRCEARGADLDYESVRTHKDSGTPRFKARYGPRGDVYASDSGTLELWLTERYCLYAASKRGALYRAEIQHGPWPLQPAEAEIELNELPQAHGFTLPDREPLLHFARKIRMVAWAPRRIEG